MLTLEAQTLDKSKALDLVRQYIKETGLTQNDLANIRVTDAYNDKQAGNVTMIYLQQTYLSLPVHNQLQVLAIRNGHIASNAGGRVDMEKRAKGKSARPSLSPETAISAALSSKNLTATSGATRLKKSLDGRILTFGDMGVSSADITTELMWNVNDDYSISLCWEVHIAPKGTADDWYIRVDAANARIVGIDNLTVYCNWGSPEHNLTDGHRHNDIGHVSLWPLERNTAADKTASQASPTIINGASYLVVPYPAESPIHPGGTPAVRTDPWTLTPGNATTLKWHSDGTNDFQTTRGNNVRAYEDRANTATGSGGNPGTGLPATSTTPDPLTFNFTPDFTVTPTQTTPVQNQQFNITNLFYWNNIIHDLTYMYGFDEVSGNFQVNNLTRGGLGNDPVLAEAQDGGGTNNANFSTPADGVSGRMQMYLWNGSPQKDGDVDNSIIVHEHGHGISNRLTGGPATASCLQNAEQMGEGWSDYYGLMYTQNWAASTLTTGFDSPRGIGTYALGQPITGTGIRSQKYCTDFSVNNKVYAASIPAAPHDRGEIWCATLWDMTWNIINQVGTINPNMFDPSAGGGNSIALRLVTEGMKLQPCSPGFISGRDGILAADQLLYGGAYSCAIKEAFRRRGMGDGASQGSSASVTDQVPSFSGGLSLVLNQNVTQVQEGQNITYTNRVGTCNPVSNYLLTDTLPANVTYVSGGTYDPSTRVVSFPVTLGTGASQNYSFTVSVNPGSYFAPVNLLDEQVTGATIPAAFTAAVATGPSNWTVSNTLSHSAPNAFFAVDNSTAITDFSLAATNSISMGANPPQLSFWHNYNTELTWDGGVVEISTNNGSTWSDLGPYMTLNGYNNSFAGGTILAGRPAFTGNSNGFVQTKINLFNFANQNIKFRFRALSDDNTAATGWYVDDILLTQRALVNMRSNLFNTSGVRINISDTVTEILPSAACTNAAITVQPSNTSACTGTTATISVTATGTNLSYQWQVSTDAGTTWTNVAGATTSSLTLTGITAAMNNNRYRVTVSNACPSTVTSTAVILTVSAAAAINGQPQNVAVCTGNTATFTVSATGSALTYQWQVSTDAGATFNNIPGATAATLTLTGVTAAQHNNQYRVVIFSCSPAGTTSSVATLTVNTPVAITTQPAAVAACENSTSTFSAAATGTGLTYQWQVSTNGGTTWTNIAGATNAVLSLPNVPISSNGNLYRIIVSGTCTTAGIASNSAALSITGVVTIIAQPQSTAACAGTNVSFTASGAGPGLTYQWQVSTNGGTSWTNIAGATTGTLTLTAVTLAMTNNQYRVVLNGTCTSNLNSNAATLTINTPVTIDAQPTDVSVCSGGNTTFSVTATGTSITYQWQISVNGGNFIDLPNGAPYSGVNTATLTISNTSTLLNGNRYRVVANGVPCGGVTSAAATLTALPQPTVELTASMYQNYTPGVRTGLYTTTSSTGTYTYQWFRNGSLVPGITTASFLLTTDDFGEYYVIATNSNGCSDVSGLVKVSDSSSAMLFIYPNPNSGIFQVRYYNRGGGTVARTLKIYDAKGAAVYRKAYNVSGVYPRIEVNLPKPASGVYFIDLLDGSGKRMATGKVNIVIQ